MHSIKTAVVVSILLVVGYAVYTTLNNERPGRTPSPGGDDWPGPTKADSSKSPSGVSANPTRQTDRAFPTRGPSETRPPWDVPGAARNIDTESRRADAAAGDIAGGARNAPGTTLQTQAGVRPEFREMMDAAQREIGKGSLVGVLRDLTPLYGSPGFSAEESRQLTELLSQLAGEVVYSRRHYLQEPYVVRAGESLRQIAQQYRVPWQLLAKINGVQDPDRPTPGSKLKVVRGPFDAIVFLDRYELVLQVDGLYAGRFPIGIGRDQPRLEGAYLVKNKMTQPTYYGPSGTVQPGNPDNPLGKYLIGLDERIGIHGTNDIRNLRRGDGPGTVCLGDRDIEDVFDMLTAESPSCPGSKVAIRRFAEHPPQAVAERGAGLPERR